MIAIRLRRANLRIISQKVWQFDEKNISLQHQTNNYLKQLRLCGFLVKIVVIAMIKVGLGGRVTPAATVSVPHVSVSLASSVLNVVGVTSNRNSIFSLNNMPQKITTNSIYYYG